VTMMDGGLTVTADLNEREKAVFADAVMRGQSAGDAYRTAKGMQAGLPPVMHAPGQVASDADRGARERLYDERKAKLSQQWRNPPAADTSQIQKPTPTNDAEASYAACLVSAPLHTNEIPRTDPLVQVDYVAS
jgi:hypothetical protein